MPIFSSFLLLFFFSSLPSGLLICFRPRTLAQKRHIPHWAIHWSTKMVRWYSAKIDRSSRTRWNCSNCQWLLTRLLSFLFLSFLLHQLFSFTLLFLFCEKTKRGREKRFFPPFDRKREDLSVHLRSSRGHPVVSPFSGERERETEADIQWIEEPRRRRPKGICSYRLGWSHQI